MAKREKDQQPEKATENTMDQEATQQEAEVHDNKAPDDSLKQDAAEFEDLLKAEKDKYLRLYAEYDNFRKRSQKERDALFATVKSDVILQILPVYDNLERALALKSTDEAFYKGIEMTMTQLTGIFDKLGVKPIDAVGKKFDANLHNAVMHIEDENYGENEIVEEFQKGFTLGDKVIRFSMVKVAN